MMNKIMPLTKILATIAVSFWAILLQTPADLFGLLVVEIILLGLTGLLIQQYKGVFALFIFAFFLGVIQLIGGGSVDSAMVTGLRMLCMTLVFIFLLATTKLQDLTEALVTQCKVPYEYAFMFTAALRFVPDFIAESKAVQEAQACRGLSTDGNVFKRIASYASVIQPLMLKSLHRSETMALSLELRGFGGKNRSYSHKVAMTGVDYILVALMLICSVGLIYYRFN